MAIKKTKEAPTKKGIQRAIGDKINLKEKLARKKIEQEAKLNARRALIKRSTVIEEEDRDEEIEDSLSLIYTDKSGEKIDVNKLKIRKAHNFIFWFFNFLVVALIGMVLVLGVYYYIFYNSGTDSTSVEIKIESKENISTNEEFFYTIKYKNSGYIALKNVSIETQYPENFTFLDSTERVGEDNTVWNIGRIPPRSEGEIKIKGKIIAKPKTASMMIARIIYTPDNFSSVFSKETTFSNVINNTGFDINFDYQSMILVNEESEITVNFRALDRNFIDEFVMKVDVDDDIKILGTTINNGTNPEKTGFLLEAKKEEIENGHAWRISGVNKKEERFAIRFKINKKEENTKKIKFYFEKDDNSAEAKDGKIVFFEKDIDLEVMKSDLNLTLISNGSKDSGTVDFKQKINYSVNYANKGESTLRDVSIMIVLDSEFLDWTTLWDEKMGKERGNTIIWTSKEIPKLAEIGIGEEGIIDFSINVMPFTESDLGKEFKIISYAQYNVGIIDKIGEIDMSTSTDNLDESVFDNPDNRSNTITLDINSDLKLKESVMYFDENNMPVGSGPLPPEVGIKSSFKVYWTLNNNLHELRDVVVKTVLPKGVKWDENNRTSVGTISYDEKENTVSWQIGRLPITVFRADAEFGISITPTEAEKNKIMVLSAGSFVEAVDTKTSDSVKKTTKPKTTRLEDDDIASISSNGIIK